MADSLSSWNFRPPPRGLTSLEYSQCVQFIQTGICRYGNQCVEAHSAAELAEWQERFELNQQKRSLLQKSYVETLSEKIAQAPNPETILIEHLDSVSIKVSHPLIVVVETKPCRSEWTFLVKGPLPLKQVALLHDDHRDHFNIIIQPVKPKSTPSKVQDWLFPNTARDASTETKIEIEFATDVFGNFRQTIVFDFGFEPVVARHLSVDVLPQDDYQKIQQVQETLINNAERWDSSNADITFFTSDPFLHDNSQILSLYPPPQPNAFRLTPAIVSDVLTTKVYKERMKGLLSIEEMTQYETLAKFNVRAHLDLTTAYHLTPGPWSSAKYARKDELFAKMSLTAQLSEDTAAGRLILTNCSLALLSFSDPKPGALKRKVYQCPIEDKVKQAIYFRLPTTLVAETKLEAGNTCIADVQFHLNRVPFCENQFAVDRVLDCHVFPEINMTILPLSQTYQPELDPRLNAKQREAVLAIATPSKIAVPVIVIAGPFGTGKTFTFAQAIKAVLEQQNTRLLVCTHSNSAADLYVKDYLHVFLEEGLAAAKPLRVYYSNRWVSTVHPTVQEYCLIENEGAGTNFRMPTAEEVLKYRVIVTTLGTARHLVQLGLPRGFFSHILVDEAAQCIECEALMPLALANRVTRIALAGDHMQLSPEVYSTFCKEKNLHVSLLERLYDYYPTQSPCNILLCENYRSHPAIVSYTSELFYDKKLVSSGNPSKNEKHYPLTFFTAKGRDVQDLNSTSYYNHAEVYEVVERVKEILDAWPKDWGSPDDENGIGVVSPYSDQVMRIRSELRRRKLAGVSVERVLNVQGKQFRVIVLSTVRTRNTCEPAPMKSKNNNNNQPSGTEVEDEFNFGFLTSARLLNTAITRAQSLVAVVGDPITLCSVGKCRKLWERFIEICKNNDSLIGMPMATLKSNLDALELKKLYGLNPLAPEFFPRYYQNPGFANFPVAHTHVRPAVILPCLSYSYPPIVAVPPPYFPYPPPPCLRYPNHSKSAFPRFASVAQDLNWFVSQVPGAVSASPEPALRSKYVKDRGSHHKRAPESPTLARSDFANPRPKEQSMMAKKEEKIPTEFVGNVHFPTKVSPSSVSSVSSSVKEKDTSRWEKPRRVSVEPLNLSVSRPKLTSYDLPTPDVVNKLSDLFLDSTAKAPHVLPKSPTSAGFQSGADALKLLQKRPIAKPLTVMELEASLLTGELTKGGTSSWPPKPASNGNDWFSLSQSQQLLSSTTTTNTKTNPAPDPWPGVQLPVLSPPNGAKDKTLTPLILEEEPIWAPLNFTSATTLGSNEASTYVPLYMRKVGPEPKPSSLISEKAYQYFN